MPTKKPVAQVPTKTLIQLADEWEAARVARNLAEQAFNKALDAAHVPCTLETVYKVLQAIKKERPA